MNMIEKAILAISPERAAKRAAARKRFELLSGMRGYDGASHGRRTQNWFAQSTSADQEIARANRTLRDRSRDLVRNNPTAAAIVSIWANYVVGNGIMPRAKTGNPELDKVVDELFDKWSQKCLPDGITDFYGAQAMMMRGVVESGEMFIRRRPRRSSDGLPVPLQIQVMEAEYCDYSKSTAAAKKNNVIINGIEFDAVGRRRGYWMFPNHPNASVVNTTMQLTSSFVSAVDIAHIFEPQRTQTRGVPWLAPVMIPLKDIDEYNNAEIIRKKIESCVVGVVIPGDSEIPSVGYDEEDGSGKITDANGNPIERFEPGMIAYAHGGREIKFNNPSISAGTEMYLRTQMRRVASGSRIPYSLMAGDFSQDNFASGRMGIMQFRRLVEAIQWQMMIVQALHPVWGWFVEAAKMAGKIPEDADVGVEWQPPEFESISPVDDAKADLIDVRMGKRTLAEVIAKTGRNPATVIEEIAGINKQLDDNGIVLDSDPRRVAINGQMQWTDNSDAAQEAGAANNAN